MFNYNIDNKFKEHFINLKQVFMYLINECNLNCPQCIYKPNNYFNIGNKEIDFETAKNLIHDFYLMGARKISFLGGEPTLYGKYQEKEFLVAKLVKFAKDSGYEYVRIDTNGTFDPILLDNPDFKLIDEISFSLDGYDEESCDSIRGKGNFSFVRENILLAVKKGYKVDITCCVYQKLLQKDCSNNILLEKLIYLAHDWGVKRVNFHGLVKDGTPIDLWSSDLEVNPKEWIKIYDTIHEKIINNVYPISVRIPKLFITKQEFNLHPDYYSFCPAKLGERVLVHPDGIIRICSGLLGTAYGIAYYNQSSIKWNHGYTNELIEHDLGKCTYCTNRSKKKYIDDFVPLCFSFKPKQDEYVYNELLEWERKKND